MKREYKIIMLLILVISIVALVLTSSYALFSFEEKGKVENKLVTGVYSSCEYEDGTTWNFDYTGGEQTFTVPCDGEYKLETWGAQGANYNSDIGAGGGAGGYSNGMLTLSKKNSLYINIGGAGGEKCLTESCSPGGYNGGGIGSGNTTYSVASTGGGGATHIALKSGLLSTLENNKYEILIVSGGGGGTSYQSDINGPYTGNGGHGGGFKGTNGTNKRTGWNPGYGGSQTSGGTSGGGNLVNGENRGNAGAFGQGGNGLHYSGGGGGGFYGGGASNQAGAGGGSGYIGNSLLTSKIMYCYNCEESSEESTKTVSTTCVSQTPTENCSKRGNGYARITLVKYIERYKESILNGTDPVLKDNLIPIKIASDGTVTKADITKEWYNYENKEWANAVILKDETKTYNNGETIPESNIESYFVWIPRFKYQIFDEGNYTSLTSIQNKFQTINIVFENKDTTPSNGTTKGTWLTHPAFTSFDSNGFWVGKFETGYDKATSTSAAQVNSVDTSKIIIKPNVYSWKNINVGNMFKNSYDYQRNLDSHMMKNTEWGATAYLQHSVYGSQTSVRINNNKAFITGYASTTEPTTGPTGSSTSTNRYESTSLGVDGTYTVNYLNSKSSVASTTGNRSGIYDMAGGSWDYVAGYTTGATKVGGDSGITSLYPDFFTNSTYTKYWDKYTSTTNTQYNNRILGDATGEMGPFGNEKDPDSGTRQKSSWYGDLANFAVSSLPWFARGGNLYNGTESGAFAFSPSSGTTATDNSFRIVLTPLK